MAVTNQQLADLMSTYVKATTAHTEAFITSVDRLIENDNRHHDQFRSRMGDLALAQAAIKSATDQNTEHRKQVVKWVLAVVVVPIGLSVVQLIAN